MAMMITIKGQKNKVTRYWPGKRPEWADDNADGEDGDIRKALERAFPSRDDVDITGKDDPRLRRLAETMFDKKEDVRADHLRIRQAENVSTVQEEENRRKQERLYLDEEDDEHALDDKRRRVREELHQRQQEEAAALLPEEEEEEWEYETDSEEEQLGTIAMIKPSFILNSERDTIAERERLRAEERALEEMEKRRLEERRLETRQIVVEEIRKDEEIQKINLDVEANNSDVDTDDEVNEAEVYEAWKSREIARSKRDREEKMVKKVRNVTEEEERQEWERKNPKPHPAPKRKWRFMQRYYHEGAFFQSEVDDIYQRDFSAPTGEDRMDKTKLPKVMQVNNFGRRGRTKWTHLLNEDTTDWNSLWACNELLQKKYNDKMAGMDAPIARPKGSKKLKVSPVH
ncbi:microfibrillar-associated protein 1A [Cinnamomum micranthum f. kanehirae]|uniref:Microfibrillar-associated protein 1A n=1 Tax=Cinnamomum micranthum f. kanehirae TaxID=337451 RepID=A0A443NFX8_9MAGN|nr:microfibrillar-associated protein 1A [Cinnamomum micranthum f. kanehirae]